MKCNIKVVGSHSTNGTQYRGLCSDTSARCAMSFKSPCVTARGKQDDMILKSSLALESLPPHRMSVLMSP